VIAGKRVDAQAAATITAGCERGKSRRSGVGARCLAAKTQTSANSESIAIVIKISLKTVASPNHESAIGHHSAMLHDSGRTGRIVVRDALSENRAERRERICLQTAFAVPHKSTPQFATDPGRTARGNP
jgi:hypothetical protein